jgi:uncharacterized delta-60 repeat protein
MKLSCTLSVLFIAFLSTAQPGATDPSFGINGVVIRKGLAGTYQDVIITPNKKILAIQGYNDTLAVITQYTSNGIPEKTTKLSVYVQGPYRLKKGNFSVILLQPDGKFLTAGRMYDLETTIFIARFNKDGSVDSSFATNGVIEYHNGDFSVVRGLIVLPDSKLLLGVQVVYDAVPEIIRPTLLRYLPDGSPDPSFGINGVVSDVTAYFVMRIQSDGKIILGGTDPKDNIQITRRNVDGSPDESFGKNGIAKAKVPYANDNFFLNLLAVQSDDKIVIAGRADINAPSYTYTICARLNADGSKDASFGNSGFIRSPANSSFSWISPAAIAMQPDGKIIIGGQLRSYGFPSPDSSYLVRLKTDGSADKSFGTNGYAKRPAGKGFAISSIALQADGKIVTGGSQVVYDEDGYYMADHPSVARYFGADIPPLAKATNKPGAVDGKFSIYPNPVAGTLFIEKLSGINIKQIEIADASGTVWVAQKINADDKVTNINVQSLPHGIYVVRITDENGEIISAMVRKY